MNNKDLFLLNVIINHYEEVKISLFESKSIEDFLNNVYMRKSIILDIIQIGTWGIFRPKEFYYTFSPKIGEILA